jgi:hypothetical protein
MKYIIITLDDAKSIEAFLPEGAIKKRFQSETGADIEEIAELLKKQSICSACLVEGQEHNCSCLESRQIGRRLYRLLVRSNNALPHDGAESEKAYKQAKNV